jgi:hypothetical protein
VAEGASAVEVARRIEAPAARIFDILANPHRHMDFDGSDMLRGAVVDRPISGVGDTFTMKMHRLGDDYLMLNYVVEFESDRRIFWEPAPGDPLGLKVTTQPKLGFLRATVGATFSLPTVTMPPSSPRSLTVEPWPIGISLPSAPESGIFRLCGPGVRWCSHQDQYLRGRHQPNLASRQPLFTTRPPCRIPTTSGAASRENGAKLSSGLRCTCRRQVVEDCMG